MDIAALRGDGLLARARLGPWLPLPEVLLLALGAAVAAVPALALVVSAALGSGRPTLWSPGWVLAGTALALLARTARALPVLDWLSPSLLRALEYAAAISLLPSGPWTYLWLATVAYHHYDLVYRVRTRGTPTPTWLVRALGGWEGRTLVLVGIALTGAGDGVLVVLVVLLAAVLAGETLSDLRRSAPQPDPTDPDL
jgi:hypothetical protein